MDPNEEIAIQIKQKFEFYFLALVFTVLGLSIQTSLFSSKLQSAFEIIAWIFFLISGLTGLSRMEWMPVAYKSYSELTYEKSFAKQAKGGGSVADKSGKLLSNEKVAEYIQHIERRVGERAEIIDKIEMWIKVKYFLHKWMFVAGLVFLVVSRAINLLSLPPVPAS